jgi:hypothetical protein
MTVDECIHMAGVPNIKTASPPFANAQISHVYFMHTPAGVGVARTLPGLPTGRSSDPAGHIFNDTCEFSARCLISRKRQA